MQISPLNPMENILIILGLIGFIIVSIVISL
jgi:hypothetical protein